MGIEQLLVAVAGCRCWYCCYKRTSYDEVPPLLCCDVTLCFLREKKSTTNGVHEGGSVFSIKEEHRTEMTYGNLHVLPLGLFIMIPVTFVITYTISVQWDHVVPGFPYISETGTLSPESCIFAQFLNVAALLLACCVYIRHRQVLQWHAERGHSLIDRRLVVTAGWCGALACFGLDVLANFQEPRVVAAHMAGALICFTAGSVYFCLQTYLSHKMVPTVNGRAIVYVRGSLAALTLILTTTTMVTGHISMSEFQGDDYKKWLPSDGGWGLHVVSTVSEWSLAIVHCAFLLTFVPEFRLIHFEDPAVTIIYLDDQENDRNKYGAPAQEV